jgi:putative membrane protein
VVSSISSVTAIFALVTLSVSGKGRTGTVLVIRDIVGDSISGFCSPEFLLLLLSAAVASFLGYHLLIGAGKIMSRMTDKIDTRKLSKIVVCFIIVLVLLLTGPFGLLILVISLLIGLIPLGMEISRIPLAGCLMIPVLIHNLFGPLF